MAVAAEQPHYQFVDDLPGVREARQAERAAAEAILHERQANFFGETNEAERPVVVDALSTAHNVLAIEQQLGGDSPEYNTALEGLRLDTQRYVAEWYRKKKPEYFPEVRHVFDNESEDFYSHGLSLRQMTENALVPIANNSEEEARRINERVEDATPHIMRRLGHLAVDGEAIMTISECSDTAIASYEYDMAHGKAHQGYFGYVPEIKKVMIRQMRIDAQTHDRYQEQIGLPGTYITPEIVRMTLERQGVAGAADMSKTELHGSQLLVTGDLMDFAAELDKTASEQWCVPVFMGELVTANTVRNYAAFRDQARERQAELRDIAAVTTEFILDLARDNFDRHKAPAHVEQFVKMQLLQKTKHTAEVAEQIFDKKAAEGLQQYVTLQDSGNYEEANRLFMQIVREAPGGGACGAGSCGLESVTVSEQAELADKLRIKPGDTVLKDTDRACRCGKKTIVYAFNSMKVNKYCTSCKATSYEKKAA